MKSLVLVAGHAIPYRFDRLNRNEGWYLKFFQAGEGALYLDHVKCGVIAAAQEADSLLIFAGGQTDAAPGLRSEGQGDWLAADYYKWFGHHEVSLRATSEEFSLDSFQDLLFGICRFREVAGTYPEKIVGWVGNSWDHVSISTVERSGSLRAASFTWVPLARPYWRETCSLNGQGSLG